jgi:hypothetical protein
VLYLANGGRPTPELERELPHGVGILREPFSVAELRQAVGSLLPAFWSDQVQPSRYRGHCHRMRFVRNISASELTGMGLLPESLEAMQPMPESPACYAATRLRRLGKTELLPIKHHFDFLRACYCAAVFN